jgi:transposase
MHSNAVPRRRHGAELKAKVLAACNEPGASIAAVALSHGLNANLVRNWLVGRGLKRTGVQAPVAVMTSAAAAVPPPAAAHARATGIEPARQTDTTRLVTEPIQIELRRGTLHLIVRWPTSSAGECTAWLRELTTGLLK